MSASEVGLAQDRMPAPGPSLPRRSPGVCGPRGSRRGAHVRACLLALLALSLPLSAPADRVLAFTARSGSIGDVATAEVLADGVVVMRLRAAEAAVLSGKAEAIADRLAELALAGLTADRLAVEKVQGQWALLAAGRLVVMADAETAAASGLTPRSLCESWRAHLTDVLQRPYLAVDPRDLILVPLGESRTVRYGGTIATVPAVEAMRPEIVSIEVDADGGHIVLRGRSPGTTVLTLRVGTAEHALTVEVKRWAAHLVDRAVAQVIGTSLGGQMAEVAALNAVLAAIRAEAGAAVRIVRKAATPTGYTIALRAGGPDFIPVAGEIDVALVGGLSRMPIAQALLMSNYPEKVTGVGALMRQPLSVGRPARLMWHHKNYAGRALVLAVRLINGGEVPARLRVGWADAGPASDEIFVGFNAMLRYWGTIMRGNGFELTVPPGSVFETAAIPMGPADVVSGLMDITPDEGADLYVEVMGREPADTPVGFGRLRQAGDPLAVTPYEFPASLEHELVYEVGGRHAHLSIGREDVVNEQGIALAGAYGVLHSVRVTMSNPGAAPARAEIAVRAGGGVARAIAVIDATVMHTDLLGAGQEHTFARYDLGPGTARTVGVRLMPAAGSNLPLTLTVRGHTR